MNAGLRTDALPPPLRRASAASWGVLACAASACAPAAFAGAGPAVELPRPLRGDLAIELFAREPDIVTPVAVDVDRRGRVWAIESNTHFPLPDYKRHPSDRILVIDDTTGDGAADRFHVFADGLHQTMAIALRDGGRLFAATRREVMVFEDPDGDDRPDRRATLARLETAEQYPHNGLTGFAFDGRGRTFFAIGENMGVEYTLTAADGSRVAGGPEGGSIFRMTEDGKELERWALGFWNTFHMAVDPTGSLFAVDNDPDSRPPCRLLHIVRGGDYGYRRWLGRKGLHPFTAWNGELPGTLPMVSGTGEGPSGIAVYNPRRLGLPSDLRGKVLVTSWGDHRIEVHALEPRGASYRSSAEPIVQGGASFRPVGIAAAPDGTVYFSDWVDESYNAHGKGRIWRLRAVPSTGSGGTGASGGTSAEGGNGAAGATGSTPPGGLDPAPLEPVRPPAPPLAARLEALLALGRDGAVEPARAVEAVLAALAGDRDPFLEGAAVDALARAAGAEALLAARGAREAEDPRVRLLLLLALRRTADPKARDALEGFLRDPDLDVRRAAVQWVGEEKLAERRGDLERTLEAGSVSGPIFEAYLAAASLLRGEAPDARDMVSRDESLLALARDASRPASVRALALRGVSPAHPGLDEVALRGFLDEAEPALRLEAVRSLRESPVQAARELLARLARDASAPAELRREAAAGLSRHLPGSTADLLALLDGAQDPLVRREAERALRLGAESGSPRRVDVPGDRERLLEGGDPREGEILFFYPRSARCSGCHAVRGRGGVAGPDLSAAGWRPREKLLESLLEPSREIAPQYATWVLMTPEGPRSGTVLGEDPDGAVRLGTGTSIVERVPREAVLSRSLAEASLMPEGIASLLTLEELRHLLAFLEAQR